jgi:tetratricopeptide (TPR) repeat protein
MNFQYGLSAALIGVSMAIVQPQVAQALSISEVDKIAESITVLIKGSDEVGSGSGILIKREGNTYTVLTAQHVVKVQGTYGVITPDQKSYSLNYSTVKLLPGVDLAVLTFTSDRSYALAKLGDSATSSRGTSCYVAGFPSTGYALTQPIYSFTKGELAANSNRPLADGYALMYNNSTLRGMSGGPVLNDRGEVIGIHGRGVEASAKQSDINPDIAVIKTEYNLGIPINTFLTLAPKVNSNLALRAPAPVPQGPKADDFFLQAEQKSKNSDYQGAIKDYDQAIALNPQYAEAYASRGDARGSLSDYQGAQEDVDRAIALNPKLPEVYMTRGNIRVGLSDFQGALKDTNQAIALNPKSADAYTTRANVRGSLSDFQGALKDANQAIALNPKSANAYTTRAYARGYLSDFQGALKDAEQAIVLNPKSVGAYVTRANIRAGLSDFQGALKDAEQAIALNPKSVGAYIARATFRSYLSDYQGSLKDAEQAIALSPKVAYAYTTRAGARANLRDYQGALKDADQAIALSPKSVVSYITRANVRAASKDYQGALRDAEQAIALNPKSSYAYTTRANVRAASKDYQGALRDADQAIALNPKFADAYFVRASRLSKGCQLSTAAKQHQPVPKGAERNSEVTEKVKLKGTTNYTLDN